MPIPRQETGLNLSRLAEGRVDPIGRPGLSLYKGACHCGANRFEVHLRETQIAAALACNCGLCHKAGYLWAFPAPGDLHYTRGGVDTLGGYETEVLRHEVCCEVGLWSCICTCTVLLTLVCCSFVPRVGQDCTGHTRLGL